MHYMLTGCHVKLPDFENLIHFTSSEGWGTYQMYRDALLPQLEELVVLVEHLHLRDKSEHCPAL